LGAANKQQQPIIIITTTTTTIITTTFKTTTMTETPAKRPRVTIEEETDTASKEAQALPL